MDMIDLNANDAEDKRWVKRRNTKVTALLDRLRNGDKDQQPLFKLAQSIEREWGGIERFGAAWVGSMKERIEDGPGAPSTLIAFRDMAKVYMAICGANRGDVDLSELDDATLSKLDVVESLVQMLKSDPWVLRDIIGMVPAFDDAVLVMILQERGYSVVGAEAIVTEAGDGDDAGPAS